MSISYEDAKALRTCRICKSEEGTVKFSGTRLVCNTCRGREYYTRNRDKARGAAQNHYAANRDAIRARAKELRDPIKRRDEQLRSNYGITLTEYHEMHAAQNGACLICSREMETLFVDHCHHTGVVRGLLCPQCNSGIGYLRDDPELLHGAIEYLAASRLRVVA